MISVNEGVRDRAPRALAGAVLLYVGWAGGLANWKSFLGMGGSVQLAPGVATTWVISGRRATARSDRSVGEVAAIRLRSISGRLKR